jgi:hypothetical protein
VLENISHWKVYVCAQLCFQVWEGNAVKTWAVYNILMIISKGENCDIKIQELSYSWILKVLLFPCSSVASWGFSPIDVTSQN